MEKMIDCHSYDFVTLPKTSILVADRLGDASYWLDEVSSYFEEAHIAKNRGQHPAAVGSLQLTASKKLNASVLQS